MADKGKKTEKGDRISDDQRFHYIGFEVFPGKPKDLFKSAKEQDSYIQQVQSRRQQGELLRDHCTLLEERVSLRDRLVMTVASVVIFATLFMPWFSAYTEIVEEAAVAEEVTADSVLADSGLVDSLAAATTPTAEEADTAIAAATATEAGGDEAAAVSEPTESPKEEIIHGLVGRKKVTKEYERLSGLGSFLALGSVGGKVFSSGFILMVTGVLFIVNLLLCIALPAINLVSLWGGKGGDVLALKLKKTLRLNWLPLVLLVLSIFLAFFGADYGFNSEEMYTSLGSSYGIGVLLDTLSWGSLVSLGCFILLAAKGIEI